MAVARRGCNKWVKWERNTARRRREVAVVSDKALEVQIAFCGPCGYAPWAVRVAEELVTGYSKQLAGVTLVPSTGGTFEIRAGEEVIFSLDNVGRFPEEGEVIEIMKEKQLLT